MVVHDRDDRWPAGSGSTPDHVDVEELDVLRVYRLEQQNCGEQQEGRRDPSSDSLVRHGRCDAPCPALVPAGIVAPVQRLRARKEYQFFGALHRAAPGLARTWWALLVLRGLMPAALAITTGVLIGAVNNGDSLAGPLTAVGIVFVLYQVLTPLHVAVSANLGSRAAAYLYDRLMTATTAPPGIAHLEDSELTMDLTVARDFDLGIMGPPLYISMDFIASGLVEMVGGLASACLLFGFAWWAPFVLGGAWIATHYFLRETAVWRDRNTDEVRTAQRHAEYAYRLAVDAPAAKEVRLFGLSDWVIERFKSRRTHLYDLQRHATRLRERSLALEPRARARRQRARRVDDRQRRDRRSHRHRFGDRRSSPPWSARQ